MDFELDDVQRAIVATAAAALARESADAGAWPELARAGLLALTLPAWLGGDELGADAAGVLLTEVGRRAACVPALATVMLGALPVVRWGSRELQERVLAGVAEGQVILTAGIREPSAPTPAAPATTAVLDEASGSGAVTGAKVGVPYAGESSWILVPATVSGHGADGAGAAVIVVAAPGAGVTCARTPASGNAPEYTVTLEAAPVVGLLPGSAAVAGLYQLAAAGAAAVAAGAVAGALDLTASHVATREQFGRPLATFQAVAQHVADIYITSRTLHLAALSACWRLASGRDAEQDAAVAAYWLAAEAPAALRACHHLHGGIGLDAGYPLHRYYSLVKDLVRFVGGADHRLDALAGQVVPGADLAGAPVGQPASV
jgi:alkylation response protein AidB-like acyl-CoA dehydrogenase